MARKKKASASSSEPDDRGFWYDEAEAERAVAFFELCLTHTKGELAGMPLVLSPWEADRIIRPLFGWKRADGTRRYRKVYVEIARKNGKSTLCAGIALYLLHADREPGAEVYSAAADREQASIVFDVAKQMVAQSPQLKERTELYKKAMVHLESASSYRVLSADAFCLAPETQLVLQSGANVRADALRAGDIILSWAEGAPQFGRVAAVGRQPPTPIYEVSTHRGRRIRTTGRHPFLAQTQGRRAQEASGRTQGRRPASRRSWVARVRRRRPLGRRRLGDGSLGRGRLFHEVPVHQRR
jgi:hypothetical protein